VAAAPVTWSTVPSSTPWGPAPFWVQTPAARAVFAQIPKGLVSRMVVSRTVVLLCKICKYSCQVLETRVLCSLWQTRSDSLES
jgi:hypothetical protein